jgi:cell shape-determining protein MreC
LTTTTKVFVILVCLFALIFTPLAIQFAARSYNWRQIAESARDQAESAYANERSAYGVAASEIEYYEDLLKTERESLAQVKADLAKVQRDLEKMTQAHNELAASRDNWETSARLLTAQLTVESERNKTLSDAKEKALAHERELQTQNLQLADRVKELTAEVAVFNQQNKDRVEELASFREENKKLRQQLNLGQAAGSPASTATPTAVAATPAAATGPVSGEVTNIKGPMATVNVGSASGVREGMVVVVTRGGDYICDLQVTANVTPNEAVGRIMYEEEGRRLRVGDKIQDATSFEARR